MKVEEMEEFLKEINEIYVKLPKNEKTFMEISGYPYYENVCSNILAFYLNPQEEHNLESRVLIALLNTINQKGYHIENQEISETTIFREYATQEGNRIDLIIQCDEFVIGIENKLYASVDNDLDDYYKTITTLNKNSVKVLLTLNNESVIASKNKFINITYSEFFVNLVNILNDYEGKNNKWYIYLLDFIKNIEGFKGNKEMESEINLWVKNHKEEINSFYEIINVYKENINSKIDEYERLMTDKIKDKKIRTWNGEHLSSIKYIVFDLGCNLDVSLDGAGWNISINMWKKSKRSIIKNELFENNYNILKEKDGHVYLQQFNYDINIDEVVNKALDLYNLVNSIRN